jgi:hypothetical protein
MAIFFNFNIDKEAIVYGKIIKEIEYSINDLQEKIVNEKISGMIFICNKKNIIIIIVFKLHVLDYYQ